MLNHLTKILLVFSASLILLACHKPPVIDNALAKKLLTSSQISPGYSISIVTNNPNARRDNASGWSCADKKIWVDAGVVTCKKSGRSGVYLTFTSEGKNLLIGTPWGDEIVRNARVIAVSQRINNIESIEMVDKSHAIINYTWVYAQHTPFSNAQLRKAITLNIPQRAQTSAILSDGDWSLKL